MEEPKYDNFYSPKNDEFYSKFQYTELSPEEHRIRLLRIHRPEQVEEKSARIQCDLLDDICMESMRGKYTTISYCAGDPRNTETIIVNGLKFNAFANLGHALRQARHFWKDRYDSQELLLWADQVCINQSITSERSHQVKFMGKIYANAEQVLISLSSGSSPAGGLEWLSTDIPVNMLYQNEEKHSDGDTLVEKLLSSGEFEFTPSTKTLIHDYFANMSRKRDSHRTWNAFAVTVLQSPWWSRAWIRQEVILSNEAHFMATFERMHWKGVFLAIRAITLELADCHKHSSGGDSGGCAYDNCFLCRKYLGLEAFRASWLLILKAERKEYPEHSCLMNYLGDAYLLAASDPRDLIYAHLGLSDNDFGIRPDYSENNSIEDVLVELSRKVYDHYGSLTTLNHALVRRGRKDILPSWVTDWRHEPNGFRVPQKPSDPISDSLFPSIAICYRDKTLRMRGSFRGTLQSLVEDACSQLTFRTTEGVNMVPWGDARIGDEVWMMYDADNLHIFRRHGRYHELVAAAYNPKNKVLLEILALKDEVIALTEADDPSIQEIEIC